MIDIYNFNKKVDELIFYLDEDRARKLLAQISQEDKLLIQKNLELTEAFFRLHFLAIPFLSTNEVAELLAKHLSIGLQISDIDLCERIKRKLIFMDLSDRDDCKKILKNSLVENSEAITKEVESENKKRIKATADWITDYISHTGIRGGRSLQRAQYFQKSYIIKLSENEKEYLKKLFNLYNFLNLSSFEPEGFEDDLLLETKDGQLVTTNKGQIVVLFDPQKNNKLRKDIPDKPLPPPKTPEEQEIDNLEKMAANYELGSLERRAVEEEIRKLKLNIRYQGMKK